jgi:hypothetical protein
MFKIQGSQFWLVAGLNGMQDHNGALRRHSDSLSGGHKGNFVVLGVLRDLAFLR